MPNPSTPASSRLMTVQFGFAAVLLLLAAILAGPVAKWMSFKQAKLALPLKQPLGTLDVASLAPFRVMERITLEPTVVEALGTQQYLSWLLEDTSVPADSPLKYASLAVTYYSGGADMVPHIPDVCLLGSGYEPAQAHENTEITLDWAGGELAEIPVRVCTFVKTAIFQRQRLTVVYSFYSNGRFVATRTKVRLRINDPTDTYAFFSKIEVSFPQATRAESIDGTRKIFERVLPVLVRDHWPDFEAAEDAARNDRAVPRKNSDSAGPPIEPN
ncbi:MAG: EpsI family protein [Planctomycetes bacterium]|nr:EpsI family protein [Planctomycetota bacterium]